jgi:Acetyltransferase (GNAT) family.
MNIHLQETDGEHPLWRELYAATREAEAAAWGWGEEQWKAFIDMQYAAQQSAYRMKYPNGRHMLIMLEGEPAGKLHLAEDGEEWVIVDFIVAPPLRRRGVGACALRLLQREAVLAGRPLRLTVLLDNSAMRLYERLGFVSVGADGPYAFMRWHAGQDASASRQ